MIVETMKMTQTTTDDGKLKVFVPLYKVDAANRLIYGSMAVEEVDDAGEMFDYATSKPLVQEWSDYIHKASGGKSFGNVRAMHGKVAAGILTDISFDDDNKAIHVVAEIIDDNEWDKVEKGAYTGLSIGGSYVKRWQENGVKKYTAKPVEVSIVDNASTKSAYFQFVKMSGDIEERPFAHHSNMSAEENLSMSVTVTNDQVVARAQELAKAAGSKSFADYIGAAREELEKAAKDKEPSGDDNPMPNEDTAKDMPKLSKKQADAVDKHMSSDEVSEKAKTAYASHKDGTLTEKQAETIADSLEGSDDDDCKDAAKAFRDYKVEKAASNTLDYDARNAVKQVWAAEDGTTFEKKAEAIAHNLRLHDPMSRVDAGIAAADAALAKLNGVEDLTKAAKKTKEDDTSKEFKKSDYAHAPSDDKKTWKMRLTKTPGGDPDKGLVKAAAKALASGKFKMSEDEVDKATKKVKAAAKKVGMGEDDLPKELAEKAAATQGLEKGIWDVQEFAGVVQTISWLRTMAEQEAAVEGDNSPIPARLTVVLAQLAQILVDWMGEEVNELIGNPVVFDDAGAPIAKFAGVMGLAKAGARNSKSDAATIQTMHDLATSLGANCGGSAEKHSHGDLEKWSAVEEQNRALTEQNTRLETSLNKALETMEKMSATIEQIAAQPAQVLATRLHVVDKAGDGNQAFYEGVHAQEVLSKASPDLLATAAISLIHRNGGIPFNMQPKRAGDGA
jgi:hypothetical protein